MQIEFTVKGKAKAKQSFKIGRNGFKYTPSDMVEYANLVRISFINKYSDWSIENFRNKPLKARINVYMLIPQSFSKVKTNLALKGELRPIIKPDCDNIAKNINDALNGIVYPDDKQIVSLEVNKFYSVNELVHIELTDEI